MILYLTSFECVRSVPHDKDALVSENLLSFDDMLGEVLSIMRNLGPHVVNHEWLGEVVFVVRVWHCLEVKSHHCTTFNITELVATSGCVAISVEEPRNACFILWEEWVVKTALPLLIEINDVVSLWAEQLSELLVLEYLI